LSQFLQTRCSNIDDPDFVAGMFCNLILSLRNNLLIGRARNIQKKDQQRHVQQVVEFILPSLQA
jgi:hypothetical protein